MGLARVLMLMLHQPSIREVTYLFRGPTRLRRNGQRDRGDGIPPSRAPSTSATRAARRSPSGGVTRKGVLYRSDALSGS